MPMRTIRRRVRASGPMQRLELDAGKLARPVLRGRDGSNAVPLPDQALETKARFIGQVITGDNTARRAEDIGGQELSYAEVKAIASGNPAVLTLAEADAELQRLNLLKKNHLDEQYVARRSVRDLPSTIASLNERLAKLSKDEATATSHAGGLITVGNHAWPRDDALALLSSRLDTLPRNVSETTRVPLGIYRGLRFGLVLHPQFPADVYLEGAITRQSTLSRDHQGPRAVLNALERIANGYGSECVRVRQDLAIAESQLRDYRERLDKPFLHERYLNDLTDLRDRLKRSLSATAQQADDGKEPRSSKLAAKIKVLIATHSIETVPQRDRPKQSTAEEPITARIRRRQGGNQSSYEVVAGGRSGQEAAVPQEAVPANDNHHAANDNRPPQSFAERIARERQRQDQGPGLP
jgi:hypothetical protein